MLDIVSRIPSARQQGRRTARGIAETDACATLYDQILQNLLRSLQSTEASTENLAPAPESAAPPSRTLEDIFAERHLLCSLRERHDGLPFATIALQQLELGPSAMDRHALLEEWLSPWELLFDQLTFKQRLAGRARITAAP
jgi:hypothetical protein